MTSALTYAFGGLVVLAVASDQFVKGAVRLAILMHIAPVIVGAVIVGFGTSAPEMVVSGIAAGEGNLDIGVGNVIGSNVANVSLVLGCATLVCAVPVKRAILRREVPISVASVVVFAALIQGENSRVEGAILILLLVLALGFILRSSSRQSPREAEANAAAVAGLTTATNATAAIGDDRSPSVLGESLRTLIGLGLVAVSAWFVVVGAEGIAEELNLTGGFVGFTLVAIGTSAPELFTAIAAARRNEIELLIGNLLGSNMFNSLGVGGVIALVGPGPVLDGKLAVWGSIMMLAVVTVSAIMMVTRLRVSRREGIILLAMWSASVVVLATTGTNLEALWTN